MNTHTHTYTISTDVSASNGGMNQSKLARQKKNDRKPFKQSWLSGIKRANKFSVIIIVIIIIYNHIEIESKSIGNLIQSQSPP